MAANDIPAAEVMITAELVERLVRSQHPDLSDEPVSFAANGWDNAVYRLGERLAVRIPRRALGAELIASEQRWLPQLAVGLPLPIPAPARVGRPDLGYPWSWSIVPWFDGEVAADSVLADPATEARRLGEFVASFHRPAPAGAPHNASRSVFIGERSASFLDAVGRIGSMLDGMVPDGASAARERWDQLTAVSPDDGEPRWLVGDLHTGNVIVRNGEITAVIDLGDLCAGDPSVDLAIAWMMFDEPHRAVFRAAAVSGSANVDDDMWQRAEAWALNFAVLYLANSSNDERLARMGDQLFRTLIETKD